MTIKSVIKMGNIKLAVASMPVMYSHDGELKDLVNDMRDTMHEYGGVGISAPQIGCNLKIAWGL